MSGTKPTPGPWHQSWDFRRLGNGSDLRVVANACGPQHVCMKGDRIADSDTVVPDKATMEKVYADASLIVRAVNCHADLVAALQLVAKGIRSGHIEDQSIVPRAKPGDTQIDLIPLSQIIDAALAKAGETE